MKNPVFILLIILFFPSILFSQSTEQVFRINVINPGVEFEQPITNTSTFSANVGIGYNGAYPNLTRTSFRSGINYVIAPFADLQFKRFYNLGKRQSQDKVTASNSGNFISLRFRMRGKSIDDNVRRKADYDFGIGPTWGIQRSYGNFHLLFDIGPQFYFDSKGNTGFWPITPQINIGFDL